MSRKRANLPGVVTRVTQRDSAEVPTETPAVAVADDPFGLDGAQNALRVVALALIDPDPNQPRKTFDREALDNLVETVKKHGVMQPPEVRVKPDGRYEIVAGERRCRAAEIAGLTEIEVLVRPDRERQEVLERQLIENIARDDLKPIETARALAELTGVYGLTHQQAGERVGLKRATVSQLLALLNLPDEVQGIVERGDLTFAHARALGALVDASFATPLARRAVDAGWSTRQLDHEIGQVNQDVDGQPRGPRRYPNADRDEFVIETEAALAKETGLEFKVTAKGGRITVAFTSDHDGIRAYAGKLGVDLPATTG